MRGRAVDALHSVRGLLSRVREVVDGVRGSNGHAHAGSNGHAHAGSNGHAHSGSNGHAHAHAGSNGHAANGKAASSASAPRVASVAEYFATLEERFVPSASRGMDAVFQWEIAGDDGATYHALIKDGAMQLVAGRHPEPTVTIAMPATDYIKVVNGELDGTRAFTTGSGKVSGKLRMAMKMRSLFPQAS